ncbi:hypothetical protein [Aquimonas sp.]|jgi:hypothetical protein|uniref:hypothetical protein n=1 Tax=Aquimonas sp. TaxID=1872588 RepID=UPI0037BE7854
MRALLLLVVGLLIGSLLTATALNLLSMGKGPRAHAAMMVTLQYQLGGAREAVETGCKEGTGARQLLVMRTLADDLEPLFIERGYDAELFARHSQQFRARLDTAMALDDSVSCSVRQAEIGKVRDTCQACHRDFGRG